MEYLVIALIVIEVLVLAILVASICIGQRTDEEEQQP